MTRIRNRSAIDTQDGGAFTIPNRPPAHLIPAPFKKRLAEYDEIFDRTAVAKGALVELDSAWAALLDTAWKADTARQLEAARNGEPVPDGSPHQEALDERRAAAVRTVDALTGSLQTVTNELAEIRDAEKVNAAKYKTAEDKARINVVKALEPLEQAMHELAQAIGVREWLVDHAPFDDSANLNVADVWPQVGATGESTLQPVLIRHIIEAITEI
jgi:hypothetical protein